MSAENNIRYRFYPSILNTFQELLDYEAIYDKYYGAADDPEITLDEFERKLETELIDKINRVPQEPSEAADRGTCFNEIVDCLIERRQPNPPVQLRTVREEGKVASIDAKLNDFCFSFDPNLCLVASSHFGSDAICQKRVSATLSTGVGAVELYGFADYIVADVVYDMKTTTKYEYGKYLSGWQKEVYPYCLIQSGDMTECNGFEYTVVELKIRKGEPIHGEMYREWFDYDHKRAKEHLRQFCECFIGWLEQHRSLITNKKIFNEDE